MVIDQVGQVSTPTTFLLSIMPACNHYLPSAPRDVHSYVKHLLWNNTSSPSQVLQALRVLHRLFFLQYIIQFLLFHPKRPLKTISDGLISPGGNAPLSPQIFAMHITIPRASPTHIWFVAGNIKRSLAVQVSW